MTIKGSPPSSNHTPQTTPGDEAIKDVIPCSKVLDAWRSCSESRIEGQQQQRLVNVHTVTDMSHNKEEQIIQFYIRVNDDNENGGEQGEPVQVKMEQSQVIEDNNSESSIQEGTT